MHFFRRKRYVDFVPKRVTCDHASKTDPEGPGAELSFKQRGAPWLVIWRSYVLFLMCDFLDYKMLDNSTGFFLLFSVASESSFTLLFERVLTHALETN